jgi:hypothetical protein
MAVYKGDGRNASQPNVTVQRGFFLEQEMNYGTAKRAFKRARFSAERDFCAENRHLDRKKGAAGIDGEPAISISRLSGFTTGAVLYLT